MKKILITGFEPFDQDNYNPSEELLVYLEKCDFSFKLLTRRLPVTFKDSFEICEELILLENPDLIIMTGLAKNRAKMNLEKMAINWIDARIPDNNGSLLSVGKINTSQNVSLDGIFTSFDFDEILKNKELKDKVEVSFHAGTFVCNYLYYKVLSTFKNKAFFLHLPWRESQEDRMALFKDCVQLINISASQIDVLK
jgi:pyroglutamyl-peptidase